MKWSTSALVVGALVGTGSFAQTLFAQAAPTFEVASIKVHSFASADHVGPPIAGNRGTFGGNLKQLIIYAYDLKVYQLGGGPSWVEHPSTDTDYYDINAKAEGDGPLTDSRARQLLRTLLADRFQLRLHRESKETPVYALVVGKAGPKFKESAPDVTTGSRASVSLATVASTFTKSPMSSLVRLLSATADRPVLDQTGLTGFYDFKIEFARDPAAAAAESSAVSLFTAVQEQLGLKLEARRAPIEVLVIDHAERPSEN
jgi:uncharacterized protein (TIGR03435 family)